VEGKERGVRFGSHMLIRKASLGAEKKSVEEASERRSVKDRDRASETTSAAAGSGGGGGVSAITFLWRLVVSGGGGVEMEKGVVV
jgi:hypothetical protein